MPTTTSPEKAERNQQIVDLYLQGRSAPEIARMFGLSMPMVRKVVGEAGVKASDRVKEQREARKPLGQAQSRVGERLAAYRLDVKQTRREAADRIGWSVAKVAAIEQATHDCTITDLLDLAGYMKCDLQEVLGGERKR